MSEYATPTNTENPVLDPRIYWKVSAVALWAVAVLGLVLNAVLGNEAGIEGFLMFDWGHNVVHVVLAAAATVFGFAPVPGTIQKTFAIVFGFVYAGLGVFGFFVTELGILHLELGENLIHLLLGGWALMAGFTAKY